VGFGVMMLKKHQFFPSTNASDLLFQPLLECLMHFGMRVSFNDFMHFMLPKGKRYLHFVKNKLDASNF